MREFLPLGSAGCQPAAFGSLAECTFARSATSKAPIQRDVNREAVRGKLPRTTGWQPVLPKQIPS